MAMNYKEAPQGAPQREIEQYAKGIQLVSDFVESLQRQRELPERFTKPVDSQAAVGAKETTLVRVPPFSSEQREAAKGIGLVVIEFPTPQSMRTLRESGHKFWSNWHEDIPDFEALATKYTEVAIDPNHLFIEGSNNKTLAQQESMVADYSNGITKKIFGVEAVIGEAIDYVNLAFAYLDATDGKERLFGEKYDYNYARTKTPTVGGYVAGVGDFRADYGLRVGYWSPGNGYSHIFAAPLVVPKV